jgi:hypothetical protein
MPGEDGDIEDQQDQGLEDQRCAEHLGAESDALAGQQEGSDDREQPPGVPVHVEAGELGDDRLREEAARADGAGNEEVVAHGGDEAGHQPAAAAQALDHEGVEAAGIHQLPGHLRVADGEEQQDDRDDDEGGRGTTSVAQRDGQ